MKATVNRVLGRWLPVLLAPALLLGCGERPSGSEDPSIYFPTFTEPSEDWPDALIGGRLVERDGCILLDFPPEPPTLVIWQHGWSIERVEPDTLRILNDAGAPVANVGDVVEIGGGMIGGGFGDIPRETALAEEALGEPIPDRCKAEGGYWGANPDIRVVSD